MLDLPARSQSGAEASALAEALARHAKIASVAPRWRGFGLAGRVLAVTLTFVLIAMALFYITRLTAYRETWLHNKIASAQTVVEAFDAGGPIPPPEDLSRRILNSVGLKSVAVVTPAGRRELALPGATPGDRGGHLRGRQFLFRRGWGDVSGAVHRPWDDREGWFVRAAR